ncbi:MAG: carbohydrate binding domain-containing protein [Candidatus Hodarchaeota archaeon]
MKSKIFLLLLISAVAFAQEPDYRVNDFSGGLNTAFSPLSIGNNQATLLRNVYLSAEIGSLPKRYGFRAMTDSINGSRQMTGIYGAINRSGRKRMYGVIDTTTSTNPLYGLGGLFVSANFGYNLDTSLAIYPYVYTGETPYWTMWRDDIFFSNGRQKPIIIHNDLARDMVLQAPGEPRIYPINDTAATGFGLDGEYKYAILASSNCGVTSGSELITNNGFENWTGDSLDDWDTLIYGTGTIKQETGSGNYRSGSSSMRLTSASGAGAFFGAVQRIYVGGNHTFQFKVWVKYTSRSDGVLDIKVSGKDAGVDYVWDWITDDNNTFTEYKYNFTTLASPSTDTLIIRIGMQDTANGKISYWDDASLMGMDSASYRESYVSRSVGAYNEKVLLANFTYHTVHSEMSCDTSDAVFDSLTYSIYRTKAYPGSLDELDTFWLVETFNDISRSDVDTLKFIDSISDDSLGTGSYSSPHLPDFSKLGRANNGSYVTGIRVGAPTYVSRNDTAGAPNSVTYTPPIGAHIATVYMMAYKDTLTGIESDSSRNLFIFRDSVINGGVADSNYVIGLPPIPAGQDHFIRYLYKAFAYTAPSDTAAGRQTISYDTVIIWDLWHRDPNWNIFDNYNDTLFIPNITIDTQLSLFYLLAKIKDSSARTYYDTLEVDSLTTIGREIFLGDIAPAGLKNITVFNSYAIGSQGSRFYWSRLDTTTQWAYFNNLALNLDDGDEGTAIIPYENHIKYFKNNSQFIILPTGDWQSPFEREKVISGIGCIAPHSIVPYLNDIYYLSEHGFVRERAVPHRENTSSYDTISVPINNILLSHTADVLRTVVGVAVPRYQEIRWSIPSIDTTFVYNTLTKGWSINDYTFNQTTYYDTTRDANIEPARDLLFIGDNSDKIFKADTTPADTGQAFYFEYNTPLWGSGYIESGIGKCGFLVSTNHLGGFIYEIRDAKGDSVYADSIPYSSSQSNRYRVFAPINNNQEFFSINVRSSSLSTSFSLKRMDIWTDDKGLTKVE